MIKFENKSIIAMLFGAIMIVVMLFLIWNYYFFDFNSQESKKWADLGQNTGLLVINVLDKEEYDDAHIKNSFLVPMEDLREALKFVDRSTKLVFYCANYLCTSSDEAALTALSFNFNDVYVYRGGMADWYQHYKKDSAYMYEGPAIKGYLNIIITPHDELESERAFKIIDAPGLLQLMKENKLL